MKFQIDNLIFQKFTDLNIGIVAAKGIDNAGDFPEIQEKIQSEEKRIRANYSIKTLPQNPKIEVWRNAYKTFGAKPKENRSSVENLYQLILKGVSLRHINNLVDIYNFISLKHMLPAGGEDLDKMRGGIALTFAGTDEAPVVLLGDKEPRPPHAGEVIYKDDISAICRRWNWREADRTKLTDKTKNCILVVEGLLPVTEKEIEAAARELKKMMEKYCGGSVNYSTGRGVSKSPTHPI